MLHFIHSLKASIFNHIQTLTSSITHDVRSGHIPLWTFFLAAALGTWNHFFYSFSGHSAIVALFCPVNESVWEHLKLLFFPFLFVSVLEYLCYRRTPLRFFYARYIGAISGMIFTVAFFYTYTGIIGRNFLLIDILLFFSSVLIAFLSADYFYRKNHSVRTSDQTFIITLWSVTALFFFVFTCFPPDLPLFYSP